jgi:D-3-phosphoglycerate dehydrogenase
VYTNLPLPLRSHRLSEVIYVSEPDVINMREVRQLLPAYYELFPGDVSFAGAIPDNCTTLLIRSATVVTSSIKDIFPNLKSIIRVGTGLDTIDTKFCAQENIRICNAPGANADAVSDYVICMMLVALRRITTLSPEDVATWNRFKFTGRNLSDQTIGIIGYGNIGKLVHEKLKGFSCKDFYVYDPFVREDTLPNDTTYAASLEKILTQSDIVTLHLPLLPETHHMLNKANLQFLPENAVLINASRGGIVNEVDIVEATQRQKITYIADTVESEPVVSKELVQEKSVIVTPHIASLTRGSESNMLKVAIDNFLKNVVIDPELKATRAHDQEIAYGIKTY